MKIFIVIDYWFPYVGGGPMHVAHITNNLPLKDDDSVTVITSKLHTALNHKADSLKYSFDVIHLGPSMAFNQIVGRLLFLKDLFIFLLKNDFDIIHVHPFTPVLLIKLVSVLKRKPAIFTVHAAGKDLSLENSNAIFSWLLGIVDKIQTYGMPYAYEIFVDKTLINKKNINRNTVYIPNGVDVNFFESIKVKKKFSGKVLFVGRFHHQKNIISLINAFNIVQKKHGTSTLTLVGQGDLYPLVVKKIRSLGLEKKVIIKKPMYGERLLHQYKLSDIFILPSVYEGFPLTLLEAWAAKLPVVSTKVGMANLILNKNNGYPISNPSPDSIADALIKALSDSTRNEKASNGFNLVKERYSWERAAKETYAIYKKVCQQ